MSVFLFLYLFSVLFFFIFWTYRVHTKPWRAAPNDFKVGTRFFSALIWPFRLWANYYMISRAKKEMKKVPQTEETRTATALLNFNSTYNIISQIEFENFVKCIVDNDFMNEEKQEALKKGESFSYEIWLFKYIAQSLEKAAEKGKITESSVIHAYYYCLKKLVENGYIDANGIRWTDSYIQSLSNAFKKKVNAVSLNKQTIQNHKNELNVNAVRELHYFREKFPALSFKVMQSYEDLLTNPDYMEKQELQAKESGIDFFSPELWLFYALADDISNAVYKRHADEPTLLNAFRYCMNKLIDCGISFNGKKWTYEFIESQISDLEKALVQNYLGVM